MGRGGQEGHPTGRGLLEPEEAHRAERLASVSPTQEGTMPAWQGGQSFDGKGLI